MIKIRVGRTGQLERSQAYLVQRLIVDAERCIGQINQLLNGQQHVIRPYNCILHLRGWYDRVRVHDPVRILVPDLGQQQGAHTGTSTTA